MSCIEFRSESDALSVRIESAKLADILESCRISAPEETGGILVGFYTNTLDCGVVTDISERPPDSSSGRDWFMRGTVGLQGWLDRLWRRRKRRYYLGEWHFHPGGTAEPSSMDTEQMTKISRSVSYKCPEPMLLLVGGSGDDCSDVRVYVFIAKNGRVAPTELLAT